jgi:hypothetical protein
MSDNAMKMTHEDFTVCQLLMKTAGSDAVNSVNERFPSQDAAWSGCVGAYTDSMAVATTQERQSE